MKFSDRKYTRLPGYDYSTPGAYFVTLCSHEKRYVFGGIRGSAMHLNRYGTLARDRWIGIPSHRPAVALDEFIIMPNHIHAIILVQDASVSCKLGDIIGAFKASVSREIASQRGALGLSSVTVWQRGFYERIIRDERELDATRRYISENPLHWLMDKLNMSRQL